jgi:uroporphyrinogen-III synthase/uroporphyrinogen III methyltransferase/synthase
MSPAPRPGPLAGCTVLVPGSAATSAGALAALLEVGAQPLVVPLIETRPGPDQAAVDAALAGLAAGRYQWLAVTSAAAVRMLDARARAWSAGTGPGSLAQVLAAGTVRAAAVGPATARALRALGVEPLVPAQGSGAAALVGPLAAAARGTRVLFARGDLAGPALVGGLRGSGVEVEDVVAYVTSAAPALPAGVVAAWSGGKVRAVLLTSPSTAHALVDRLGPPPPGTAVACIGPTTARAARDLALRVDVVSPEPTAAALVGALVAALTSATA